MTTSGTGAVEPDGYGELLADLKARVRATQVRAARAANTEVLRLYWSIGRDILDRQSAAGWGSKIVTRLATDLSREFPDQRGWSASNLKNMRRIAEVWSTFDEFGQRAVGRLPWGHIVVLLERLTTRDERDWYAERAVENGWTRNVLEHHIKVNLRTALGAAPTNFTTALDSPDSELAQQLVKDPYVFEHLGLLERKAERDVEQALMDRLQDTMLELGRGMAFVGRQVRLTVPDDRSDHVDEFYVDLLFFLIWLSLMRVLHVHDARRGVRIGAWLTGILVMSSTRRLIRCRSSRSGLRLPGGAPSLCSGRMTFRSRRSSRSWPTSTT
jgi:predicted nuclease of restriction endonuclease-like (RecB) superfamily